MVPPSFQRLIFEVDTIKSGLGQEMNGRLHSKQEMAYMNGQ
ncbi:hypothetical protein MtrunA17_Chr8g0335101 [Medicago truncatula]|uniref:Uncharacterized protein n=1 Tax=Medicago truncatula TaxID=3880 RepID=A0A396GCQ3_MEDTR|nr:hypothetical protein MtrunA17_Chr8g0335101 [Medicago truncatula]